MECVFCEFTDKEVIVYDDDLCFAIISKNPINNHHVMVIPKEHFENFTDLPESVVSHLIKIVQRISKAVKLACDPSAITHVFDDDDAGKGYNLVQHFKIHIIPRFAEDISKIDWGELRNRKASDAERAGYANEIKNCFK